MTGEWSMRSDICIIGAGVVGCALARVLSRCEADIAVLEQGADVAEGASKANSGIVHAGFDAQPGTLKARLNVEGAAMYPALCKELGVPYSQPGALVLGFSDEDRKSLEGLLRQGQENGVAGLRILSREEVLERESALSPDVRCALAAPTSGLVSPYELTYALADHAAVNGVRFLRGERVERVERTQDGLWRVMTGRGEHICRVLVNCAGAGAEAIHAMMGGAPLRIVHRRGQYILLDRMERLPVSETIFQCPTRMGKGVLVTPTVHGNLLLGPTAEDIEDGFDSSTTAEGLREVLERCRISWPEANTRLSITSFSGIRAHEERGDFIIGAVEGQKSAYEAVGIESPGLSAAPAIAEMLGAQIARECGLRAKASIAAPIARKKPFHEMNACERAAAVAENPQYGSVICRCEVVTEAEIREAIRRPVGATTIDGVKRRTRAGMGRCQGGFCAPRVAELLSEELGIPLTGITKSGGESRLLTGTIGEALKGGERQ